jgi:hypothetical protein
MSLRWADSGQAERAARLGTRVEYRKISRVSIKCSSNSTPTPSKSKTTKIGLLLSEPPAYFFFIAELLDDINRDLRCLPLKKDVFFLLISFGLL